MATLQWATCESLPGGGQRRPTATASPHQPCPSLRNCAVCDPVRGIEWAPESAMEFPASSDPCCPADKRGTKHAEPAARAAALEEEPQPSPSRLAKEGILAKRRLRVGPNLALFFQEDPLHIVRGQGCELFDAEVGPLCPCVTSSCECLWACIPRVRPATLRSPFSHAGQLILGLHQQCVARG
jgi:hypothetical protein